MGQRQRLSSSIWACTCHSDPTVHRLTIAAPRRTTTRFPRTDGQVDTTCGERRCGWLPHETRPLFADRIWSDSRCQSRYDVYSVGGSFCVAPRPCSPVRDSRQANPLTASQYMRRSRPLFERQISADFHGLPLGILIPCPKTSNSTNTGSC